MKDLQPFFDRLKVPPADESHTARARDRSLVAFRNAPGTERKSHWTAWIFATGAAAACVALALVLHGQNQSSSARVFAELEKLFPGQLQAVIQNGEQTDLRLSSLPNPELSTDQRVRITVRSGGETTDIIVCRSS